MKKGGSSIMKEVFEQYGGVLIAIVAIVALLAIVHLFLQNGESGLVYRAFADAFDRFSESATGYIGS